ncbi:MAG: hypothetical protein AB7V46_19315 [Thermomicrobiales bacterium]
MQKQRRMPPASWIAIGAGIGVAFGAVLNNLAIGIAIGAAIGVAVMSLQSRNGATGDNEKGKD